jgi:hypothetical protein
MLIKMWNGDNAPQNLTGFVCVGKSSIIAVGTGKCDYTGYAR